ncbi:Mediator of RNA polymerase II transcription subunit [Lachnellula suecica]|uniref:Mediator of RNA polymerase II transcription subunit 7 n=1 Tax=Lachnellula suecica TaxID=602035 RepID=A0A8T9CGN6_9HELO|nr:Mediator of RNA polymerase II transcription subunit [Lachnellula suecica]
MEEPPQPNPLAAAFPAPPPFWQSFTPEHIESISKLRRAAGGTESKAPDVPPKLPVRLLELPSELRFLQPPEPPTEGIYRCFGDAYNLKDPLPTLEELGETQLYTPPSTPEHGKKTDRAFILKRLAKSLLLNFLELVGIMSTSPEGYAEKLSDLRTLSINFHHLLNEYRPHQARESLILMMQDQLERSRAETEVEGLSQAKLREEVDGMKGIEEEVVEEGRDVWEALEREFS